MLVRPLQDFVGFLLESMHHKLHDNELYVVVPEKISSRFDHYRINDGKSKIYLAT